MIWDEIRSEKGITLLSLALQMIVIGVFLSLALGLYKTYIPYKTSAETGDKLATIQEAMEDYYVYNGRYPCPAPLNAGLDSPAFGKEVTDECQDVVPVAGGTFRTIGRDGRTVRTGAVPVRTLNLPDKYIYDGYNNRFVYAVTEMYAQKDFIPEDDQGAISILDARNNDATSTPGNVVQLVFSTGGDANGTYSLQGTEVEPCDNTSHSGANCDFDNNATFVNTLQKSHNESSNDYFTHMISYGVTKSAYRCNDDPSSVKDTTFLIDTSGSMLGAGLCPPGMGRCSRMDVARWALRRVVPAVIHQTEQSGDPGKITMTGFVGLNTTSNVDAELNKRDVVFYDPAEDANRSDQETADQLNDQLMDMCPEWWHTTPLGIHIDALADDMGDGESGCNAEGVCDPDKRRINRITVLSDGENMNGKSPIGVAQYIKETYPNMVVNVIDVAGTARGVRELQSIASITGGEYYKADNPDELLNAFYHSSGICDPYIPINPVDTKGCASRY